MQGAGLRLADNHLQQELSRVSHSSFIEELGLTTGESRIQSKLIKPVWSQVKKSKGKEEELKVFRFTYKLFGAVDFVSLVLGAKRTIPSLLTSRMQLLARKEMGTITDPAKHIIVELKKDK